MGTTSSVTDSSPLHFTLVRDENESPSYGQYLLENERGGMMICASGVEDWFSEEQSDAARLSVTIWKNRVKNGMLQFYRAGPDRLLVRDPHHENQWREEEITACMIEVLSVLDEGHKYYAEISPAPIKTIVRWSAVVEFEMDQGEMDSPEFSKKLNSHAMEKLLGIKMINRTSIGRIA